MSFFERNKLKHPKGFSDEEIDRFVEHLRDNGLTIDTEEEALAFLNFQTNKDPSQIKKKYITDEQMIVPQYSSLYNLWLEFPEYHTSEEFDIYEFILDQIVNTHNILKKNFQRLNPDTEFEMFDENKQDLVKFVEKIQEHAEDILKTIDSKYSISYSRACEEIDNLRSAEETDNMKAYGGIDDPEELERIMNSIINDESMKSLGGFENADELKAVMKEFMDSSDPAENADIDTEIRDNSNSVRLKDGDLLEKKVDAEVLVGFSRNKVRAWICILPPRRGGNDVTEESVLSALDKNGIVYGIDKFAVKMIKQRKPYFKLIEIAAGTEPQNGTNGTVTELFSRENRTIDLKEDKNGQVDYKELNVIKSVRKGETIAEITLPTAATDGIQVTGETVKGTDGQYPKIHCGKNTSVSADRTKIIADIDGEIFFEDGKFCVKKQLVIEQDIDSSIGNIDFPGDLIIRGNVKEGFTVKAEGDLEIKGYVEAATLKANGNITIEQGVNGGQSGLIDAGGSVKCQYLQYCTVIAKGNVVVDQILGCDISTEGIVKVTGPKGKIAGGKIFGGLGIEAKSIGGENSNGLTTVIVGMTSAYVDQKKKYQSELEEVETGITKLRQNINYMKSLGDQLNAARKAFLDKLVFQLNVRNVQKNNILNHIKLIDKRISEVDVSNVEIRCQVINPPVNVNFNGVKYLIDQKLERAKVYLLEDSVYVSSQDFTKRITQD